MILKVGTGFGKIMLQQECHSDQSECGLGQGSRRVPVIKGILFDKDGTLVDFQATWFAIGDLMALQAAGGDRSQANALMEAAGYDFETTLF